VPKPTLQPSEREIETYRANRTQGSRAVGGHLLLTNQRVLFYPHKVDSETGGKSWECSLTSISDVGLSARGSNPFNGSMRRRLQIDRAGETEYFVVSKPDVIVAAIRQAVGR
jgi:hypothetical protein